MFRDILTSGVWPHRNLLRSDASVTQVKCDSTSSNSTSSTSGDMTHRHSGMQQARDSSKNELHLDGVDLFSFSKRMFDILIAISSLPAFIAFCVVFFILNLFWNHGPLFFFQVRAGKFGEPFLMFKFRTMVPAQTARGPNDPLEKARITPLGKWMRQTRMDEIPQILNVLLGQMSIIGPRPEILEFDKQYREEIAGYSARGIVRPGMTGYAQVMQGYTDNLEMVVEKNRLDQFYINNMSWKLDLKILARTVGVVFSAYGAQ